jgi:hypothetical protein
VQKWLSAARPKPLAQPQKAAAITLNLKEDLKEEVFGVRGGTNKDGESNQDDAT